MTAIENNLVVEIDYTMTTSKGEQLANTNGREPYAYIHGSQSVLPGLENQLTGKEVGNELKFTLSPLDAYGERDESLIEAVKKEQFGPDAQNVQPGMQFQLQAPDGRVLLATAVEVNENEVVLDRNHPLAGESLNFDVKVVSVRKATEEELQNGLAPKVEKKSCSNNGCC